MSSCAECTADAPAPAATPHAPAAGVAGSEAAHPRATLAPTNEDWQYGVGRAGAVARLLRLRLKLGRRRPADASRHAEALCGDEGMLVASSASDTECLDEVGITAPTLLSCLAGQGAEADAGVTQGLQQRGESGPVCVNTLGGELQREEDPGRPRSQDTVTLTIVGEGGIYLGCIGAGVHETGRSNSITNNAEDKDACDACCQCIYWICDMC